MNYIGTLKVTIRVYRDTNYFKIVLTPFLFIARFIQYNILHDIKYLKKYNFLYQDIKSPGTQK